MKKGLLLLVLIVVICRLQAQIINTGWVYDGTSSIYAPQCYIDKIGNRYQVIIYQDNFVIDSLGTPVTIHKTHNPYAIAVIKYDTCGNYLYYISIQFLSGFANQSPTLGFNSSNEVYFYIRFPIVFNDSMDITDSRGILYKRIIINGINLSSKGENDAGVICKMNTNGQFVWANTIVKKNLPLSVIVSGEQFNSLIVNRANEVIIHYNNVRPENDSIADTFAIVNSLGVLTTVAVSTQDLLFKFSDAGIFLSVSELFKNRIHDNNRVYYKNIDSSYTYEQTIYRAITYGYDTYSIVRLITPQPDTFKCSTPIPLSAGYNVLLIKTNRYDSIIWAKLIGTDTSFQYIFSSYGYQIDIDTIHQILAIGMDYCSAYFQFTNDPSLSGYKTSTDIYIGKLDTSGNFLWQSAYTGTYFNIIHSLTFNIITHQLILAGSTYSNDFRLGNYTIPSIGIGGVTLTTFFACIDSSNNIFSAQAIKSKNTPLGVGIDNYELGKIGYPITNLKGQSFFSGSFYDSIQLPCKTLYATMPNLGSFGEQLTSGFVLMLDAQIPKDTSVCRKMVSPSGKYIWDSSYIYFDTLANSLGCDSVLLFRLKVLQTKSTLDSTVCKSMLSFSKKYTYTASGKYVDTIPNINHCDSIITLNLTVLGSTFDSIAASFCKNYLSPSGKYTYTNSGKYFDTLTNIKGCDSIIILNLTLLGSTFDSIAASFCKNYLSPSGKYIYTNSGRYFDTLTNIKGCDSIIIINLFSNQTKDSISINVCDTFKSPSGKYRYSKSGIFTDTIQNTKNCDSIITINLTVSKPKVKATKSNDIDCTNKLVNLLAEGAKTYLWNPTTSLSNFQISNPIAIPSSKITYTVIGTDSNGCKDLDSVTINVTLSSNHQSIANVFTPNGDGINECFSIDSPSTIKSLTFYVFNRWGTQVFFTTNPEGCWDGKNESSQPVSDGTYFYIIEGESNCGLLFKLRGTVEVLR